VKSIAGAANPQTTDVTRISDIVRTHGVRELSQARSP
jgi:hypothetical protein